MEQPLYKRILPADYSRLLEFKRKRMLGKIPWITASVYEVNKNRSSTTLNYIAKYTNLTGEGKEFLENVKENWEKHFVMTGEELCRYLINSEQRKYKVLLNSSTLYIVNNKKFQKINTFSGFTAYLEPVVTYKSFASTDTTDTFSDLIDEL